MHRVAITKECSKMEERMVKVSDFIQIKIDIVGNGKMIQNMDKGLIKYLLIKWDYQGTGITATS